MPKKDFAGKNKTKNTYDKDWELVKVRQKGGTFVQAWVPKSERKELQRDEDEMRQSRIDRNSNTLPAGRITPPPAAGGTPTAPVDVGGLGNPNQSVTVPGSGASSTVPPWWIGNAITNPNENQLFANAANALMPVLSPEDSMNMGKYLATNFKDVYGNYSAMKLPVPNQITNERQNYLNPQRAQMALTLLDRMQKASGVAPDKMGKGYDFLRNALGLMNQYNTPGSPMTREQYAQFQSAVQAMQAQAGKDIGAYANLAQLFNLPGFTAGPIVSNTQSTKLNV